MSAKKRESLRGAGRDHAGATDVTMRVWYALSQAGETGLTLDELVEKVGPSVPRGYAWRRYVATTLRQRRAMSGFSSVSAPSAAKSETVIDTPGRRQRAIHYVIRDAVQNMLRYRTPTALRRPGGRYVVGPGKPKSVFSDEFHDFDGSVSRKAVAQMDMVRQVGLILQQIDEAKVRGSKHNPAISQAFETVMRRWHAAHVASSSAAPVSSP